MNIDMFIKENEGNIPFVIICGDCQSDPKNAKVDLMVKLAASHETIKFSHGMCARHYAERLKEAGVSDEEVIQKVELARRNKQIKAIDLEKFPEVAKTYSMGLFTTDQVVQAQATRQLGEEDFKGKLKKLAGINL